jgi:hypothetical protein
MVITKPVAHLPSFLPTHLPNELISRNNILLEKLIVPQLAKKSPAFYGN